MNKPKPNVIMISGLATDGTIWKTLISNIKHLYQCHPIKYSNLLTEEQYNEVINKITSSSNQNIIMGWSIGASIIAKYIESYAKWQKIILLSFTPRMTEDVQYIGYKPDTFRKMIHRVTTNKSLFCEEFFNNISNNKKRIEALCKAGKQIQTTEIVNGLKFLQTTDLRERINLLFKYNNVYAINGNKDRIIPNAQHIITKSSNTNANIHTLNNTTHDLIYEQQDYIMQILAK